MGIDPALFRISSRWSKLPNGASKTTRARGYAWVGLNRFLARPAYDEWTPPTGPRRHDKTSISELH
ncbi:hypothetical protein BDZ89DRAFT_1069458 [Hymenopellis radicata]|nr:hypothetical protein BDZ89DRAFT_1069458 [Hymenopellis radicata]